jgi:hypothetical protein
MPVPVRNLRSGVVCFSDVMTRSEYTWAAAGDAHGEDVQMIPDDLAQNVELLKAVRKGVFVIEAPNDPAIRDALVRQAGSASDTDQAAAASMAALDRSEDTPLVVMTEAELEGKGNLAGVVEAQMSQGVHEMAELDFDPADYTVDEVVAYAEENPEEAQAILDAETAGQNRTTLVRRLQPMVEDDAADEPAAEAEATEATEGDEAAGEAADAEPAAYEEDSEHIPNPGDIDGARGSPNPNRKPTRKTRTTSPVSKPKLSRKTPKSPPTRRARITSRTRPTWTGIDRGVDRIGGDTHDRHHRDRHPQSGRPLHRGDPQRGRLRRHDR